MFNTIKKDEHFINFKENNLINYRSNTYGRIQ